MSRGGQARFFRKACQQRTPWYSYNWKICPSQSKLTKSKSKEMKYLNNSVTSGTVSVSDVSR